MRSRCKKVASPSAMRKGFSTSPAKQTPNFFHPQHLTISRPGSRTCTVGMQSEYDYGANFFWVLGGIPDPSDNVPFEYFIIPSHDMAINVQESFRLWVETPGRAGQQHDSENRVRAVYLPPRTSRNGWSIEQYRNRWDMIEASLDAEPGNSMGQPKGRS